MTQSATRLSQLLAVAKGVKARTASTVTTAYHTIEKPGPMNGVARTYVPRDDDGEALPPEQTKVQVRVPEELRRIEEALTRLVDVTATIDKTNGYARADVVVDGVEIVKEVPATTLLSLEKQLVDLRTIVSKIPTLDPSESWSYDPNSDAWRTEPVKTTRTKKVPRNHVRSEATDRHPAQVDLFHEDVVVGDWTTVKFSGAVPQARVTQLLKRVDALAEAVKSAREAANTATVTDQQFGAALLGYVFAE